MRKGRDQTLTPESLVAGLLALMRGKRNNRLFRWVPKTDDAPNVFTGSGAKTGLI